MIHLVIKYHKVVGGETSSADKIEKANATEAYEKALSEFYTLNKNYTDDKTVLVWKTPIICPSDVSDITLIKSHSAMVSCNLQIYARFGD